MEDYIENKVAKSGLINVDLADFYPKGGRKEIEINSFLHEGLILKEKEFRQKVKDIDWKNYQGFYVNVKLNEEAIIPNWAYMLISSKLLPYAKRVVFGSKQTLETVIFIETLKENISVEEFKDKRVLIKGCGDIEIPQAAFMEITNLLQPYVKSLMFGEACSSVPVFKK